MRSRIIVIMTSSILAFFIMSGGYGFWKKTLKIEGNINVVRHNQKKSHNSFALLSTANVSSNDTNYQAKTVTEDVYLEGKYENTTESREEYGDSDLLEDIKDYEMIND